MKNYRNSKGIQMRHLYSDPVRWWKKQGSEKKKRDREYFNLKTDAR